MTILIKTLRNWARRTRCARIASAMVLIILGLLVAEVALATDSDIKPVAREQLQAWRKQIRSVLFVPAPLPPLRAESHGTFEPTADVIAERITYETQFGLCVPAILYLPKSHAGKLPALIESWVEKARAAVEGAAIKTTRKNIVGRDLERKTIYHSPQTPGYTCWVGAWQMPDQSLMVTFKQATGPLEGRPRSIELLKQMGSDAKDPQRDFTGLSLANIYLRSTDGGKTWNKTAEESFPGPLDRPSWGGSHIPLAGGAILRAIDGSQLPLVPDLPRRIYFEQSSDLGRTWTRLAIPPEPRRPVENFLGDFADCISRVRRLKDGRLLATGVVRTDPNRRTVGEPLLMLSSDEGNSWQPQSIDLPPEATGAGVWNEWDTAELPTGDLLCVFRRTDPQNKSKQVRWQGVLRRAGEKWSLADYRPAPFEHSGHPELLATREGIVLHIATTGTHWTDDAGASWQPLTFADRKDPYRSRYYPRSLQTDDGQIIVFSHVGYDNAYGQVDQAIVMDTFRLATE